MTTGQIVGIAFLIAGLFDLILGFLVIGPRVPDEGKRRIVQIVLTLGAVALIAFGAAFLSGAMSLGNESGPGM